MSASSILFDDSLTAPRGDDLPFVQCWGGRFESVFLLLHPFLRVAGRNPWATGEIVSPDARTDSGQRAYAEACVENADSDSGPNAVNIVDKRGGGSKLLLSRDYPDFATLSPDDISRLHWSEVGQLAGLEKTDRVHGALLSSIGALRKEFCSPDDVSRLVSYAEQCGVYLPSEGQLQGALLAPMARLFGSIGCPTVLFQREFDSDPVMVVPLAEITSLEGRRGSLFDEARTLLVTVDWDSFFTFVAGPRSDIARWVADEELDGFFADAMTTYGWWNDAPARQGDSG